MSRKYTEFPYNPCLFTEGNGNPLQCSCLESPRDGGAWWAAIYGVAQSRTRLKRLSSSSSFTLKYSHPDYPHPTPDTFVIINEAITSHLSLKVHSVYLGFMFDVVHSVGMNKCVMTYSHHYTSLQYCSGEGNGTPLQYSCLENPMDGGAWWAAVHGVTKSRT